MKFDISLDDEESLLAFNEDLLAAIIRAKQVKFGRENDGAVWLPIDIDRKNAFQILAGMMSEVERLGGHISLENGLTVRWVGHYSETIDNGAA